jgi:glutamate transport system substrate-binding protein
MKLRTLAVTLAAGSLLLSACGKSGTPDSSAAAVTYSVASNVALTGSPVYDKIKAAKKIVIGVKDDQPGIGYKDPTTATYSGIDIETAKIVAAGLGLTTDQISFTPIQSSAREPAIQNGQVDLVIASYTITTARKALVSFAGPYFVAGQDLLVLKDNTTITGPESLKGKTVCSVSGSTPIQRIKDNNYTDAAHIVELQKYSDCVTKLEQGSVDAVTTDDAILKGYAAQEPNKLKVVGKPFSTEPYGIGLKLDDSTLRGKIDDILQAAINDGDWKKAYDATLGKSGSTATPPTIERY